MADTLSSPSIGTSATTGGSTTTKILPNQQRIHFISLISRNDKPLYIQAFDEEPNADGTTEVKSEAANRFLKYNFLSHMALDIFSSPTSLSLREQQQDSEGVLLLFIQDEVTVYGYETNNELKIIVGMGINSEIAGPSTVSRNSSSLTRTPSTTSKSSKNTLKDLVLQIHKCYLRTIFNPFNNLKMDNDGDDNESILASTTFDKNMHRIVSNWN